MLKIGHRGAGYEPENTLKAFQKALDLNADGIELDVHLSADGYLIVIHDETIDRTTNGKGLVNTFSLSELKSFLIDDQYQIPTLNAVFDLVDKKCLINIELKGIGTARNVTSLIEEYIADKNWNYEHFIVSSFYWDSLQEVHNLNSNIAIGVLTEEDLDKALAFFWKAPIVLLGFTPSSSKNKRHSFQLLTMVCELGVKIGFEKFQPLLIVLKMTSCFWASFRVSA